MAGQEAKPDWDGVEPEAHEPDGNLLDRVRLDVLQDLSAGIRIPSAGAGVAPAEEKLDLNPDDN
ncbi:hypothetical protein [Roseibium hamelinense]|uniref:hypothetical protein n=1 Tax=Roseibium hamelinense TaxID=150831 RepID=UPI001478DBBD|nr:hypothetical protein [Roseibium hamelinense]